MGKPIYNISPFTLLDYPDRTACILWFAGCNMRCPYCYNPDIVKGKGKFGEKDVYKFLLKRKGLLDGVVFSGGECTLHPEIFTLAARIKEMGFLVKIDTNASRPDVVAQIIAHNLVDYFAIDFKANRQSFGKVTGTHLFPKFIESLDILLKSSVPFEIRTTVHSSLITAGELEDMFLIIRKAGYKGKYYIQHFENGSDTLGKINRSDLTVCNQLVRKYEHDIVLRNSA